MFSRVQSSALHDTRYEQEWIIHGDYRAQNLKFDGSDIRAILDLDTACPASRLYDLGYALSLFPRRLSRNPSNLKSTIHISACL